MKVLIYLFFKDIVGHNGTYILLLGRSFGLILLLVPEAEVPSQTMFLREGFATPWRIEAINGG